MRSNFLNKLLIFVLFAFVAFGQLTTKSNFNGKLGTETFASTCFLTRETSVCQGFPARVFITANVHGGWPRGIRAKFVASSGIYV